MAIPPRFHYAFRNTVGSIFNHKNAACHSQHDQEQSTITSNRGAQVMSWRCRSYLRTAGPGKMDLPNTLAIIQIARPRVTSVLNC